MITIELIDIMGFEGAVKGMRNPMKSRSKGDSVFGDATYIGPNDMALMRKLDAAGVEHRKFMRFIHVQMDVTAPLYWWKEADTYKIGKDQNSESTMHTIHSKEFELADFSIDHLFTLGDIMHDCGVTSTHALAFSSGTDAATNAFSEDWYTIPREGACVIFDCEDQVISPIGVFQMQIRMLNRARELYLKTKNKKFWWQIIQLLPTSYNQMRTIDTNYETLAKMYRERKDHKLDEWHRFCDYIKCLPYSELITMEDI